MLRCRVSQADLMSPAWCMWLQGTKADPGVLPLSLQHIFEDVRASAAPMTVRVSHYEVSSMFMHACKRKHLLETLMPSRTYERGPLHQGLCKVNIGVVPPPQPELPEARSRAVCVAGVQRGHVRPAGRAAARRAGAAPPAQAEGGRARPRVPGGPLRGAPLPLCV